MKLIAAVNVLIKIILLAAIGYMFLFPDQPQFEGKSMMLRALLYPIFTFVIPVLYYFKKTKQYPHMLDLLWSFTFTVDIVGNDLNLYNRFPAFDDVIHFLNGIPYIVVLFVLLHAFETTYKLRFGSWGKILFAFSFFFTAHALWEMWEFSMDYFFGTFLQPGGMQEATANNVAGIIGAVFGLVLLSYGKNASWYKNILLTPLVLLIERYKRR